MQQSEPTPETDAVALGVSVYSNDDVKLRDVLAHARGLERKTRVMQRILERIPSPLRQKTDG